MVDPAAVVVALAAGIRVEAVGVVVAGKVLPIRDPAGQVPSAE
jgi:hypothetical protein